MTKLSVNINKIATIRNARGAETPSVTEAAIKIQEFGGQGITIHPRPDERHITRKDVYDLKPLVYTEFNIEGNPHRPFIDMVLEVKPEQVTLVPDADDAITSNAGWDCEKNLDFLKSVMSKGASVDWKLLQQQSIHSNMSAKPMVDYFAPVMIYLKRINAGRKYTLPEKLSF